MHSPRHSKTSGAIAPALKLPAMVLAALLFTFAAQPSFAQKAASAPEVAEKRADLELIKNLIHNHTRRVARYRCDDCGFKARQFHWRCPACGGWETFPPKRTEEFDINP